MTNWWSELQRSFLQKDRFTNTQKNQKSNIHDKMYMEMILVLGLVKVLVKVTKKTLRGQKVNEPLSKEPLLILPRTERRPRIAKPDPMDDDDDD